MSEMKIRSLLTTVALAARDEVSFLAGGSHYSKVRDDAVEAILAMAAPALTPDEQAAVEVVRFARGACLRCGRAKGGLTDSGLCAACETPGALTWTCIACGVVHPIDHAGFLAGGYFMACIGCERTVMARCLRPGATDRDIAMDMLEGMFSRGNPAVQRRSGGFLIGAKDDDAVANRREMEARDIAIFNGALDAVYTERAHLVAILAALCRSLGFEAGLGVHDQADSEWDPAWRTIIFVDIPDGAGGSFQASWHLHDRDRHLVAHLPTYSRAWDGHTTPEKYERIAAAATADQRDVGVKWDCRRCDAVIGNMHLALSNCLMLARMKSKTPPSKRGDWSDIVRFCASAGVVPSILRGGEEPPIVERRAADGAYVVPGIPDVQARIDYLAADRRKPSTGHVHEEIETSPPKRLLCPVSGCGWHLGAEP